ncbi:MAG TPA: FAD-dependent monooxygenase [Hyphomicrobiaceae bacterium]|nr:FAD-dependent monooxygenase [Hyphomicrobiaceae bacterium]
MTQSAELPSRTVDAVVAGGGPAGLAAALALAHAGLSVALSAPEPPPRTGPDTRTTALFGGTVELLRHLGAWSALEPVSAPLLGLRMIDDTGSLLRAPETLFRAEEVGLAAFGYNIENSDLNRALGDRVATSSHSITRLAAAVGDLTWTANGVSVGCGGGIEPLTCRLVAGADGRNSFCRTAAGIEARRWSYPQAALAVRFKHTRPHDGISTEFHRRSGPLTTVPLPGLWSSLVWVETPEEAERLRGMPEGEFVATLEARLQGLLGSIEGIGPRTVFPLMGLTADPLAHNRVVLVGEAGHVIPPIGAQGLNLGFRDVAWIAELAGRAVRAGTDPGSPQVLADYVAARTSDVGQRTWAVDLLNRSLLADFLPVDAVRGLGVLALNALPALRRRVMQEGIGPAGDLPELLRPVAPA